MKRLACAIAFALTLSGAPDVLQQLSIPKADAGTAVLNALASGSPDYHRVRGAFKAASPAARAALVEQLLAWTKAYVNSPQFAKDYAAYREQAKPQKPEAGESVEEELARQKKDQEQQLADAKASLKEMPAEMRKEMEKSIKELEKTFREMQNNAELQASLREGIEMQRAGELQDYEEQLATWREEYPADPKQLVKQRLEQFLETTEDVDFEAKLVKYGSKMRFADEDYESKDSEWKLAYRAGKPATDAARAFAEAWLGEL
ncbi:MAG TPA: hypothetical protein VEU30_05390 [Thermoanaerobaculia bacterium]|nr:hypothetical protein [Thermoanaerobaculia bacterium]